MTGRRVVATLAAVVVATLMLPPIGAWAVNQLRLRRASSDTRELAARLVGPGGQVGRVGLVGIDVLCGPGLAPDTIGGATERWAMRPVGSLAAAMVDARPVPADPWGNCYLVNIGAARDDERATLWILSAGPNGLVETPFASSADQPAGDDVVSPLS